MSSRDMWQPEQPSSQTVATRGLVGVAVTGAFGDGVIARAPL